MRTMLRVTVDIDAGNAALQNGSFKEIIEGLIAKIKPEATYFTADQGSRTMYAFFDMTDSSMMPVYSEPLFRELNALVEYMPVMNAEDLMKGLSMIKAGN